MMFTALHADRPHEQYGIMAWPYRFSISLALMIAIRGAFRIRQDRADLIAYFKSMLPI